MNTIQRYDSGDEIDPSMWPSSTGEWVSFDDYRALAEEAEYQEQRLRHEIDQLRDEIDQLNFRIRDLNEDLMGASL